jgi:uncharacterized protein (TIGR03437 family)
MALASDNPPTPLPLTTNPSATTGSTGGGSTGTSPPTTGPTFTATASTGKGGAWLLITPATGSIPGSITASVDPQVATGLAPGIYTGKIEVDVPGTAKETNTVHVALKVFSPDEKPRLDVDPAGVAFRATLGGSDPASQPVNLIPEGVASLAWTATVSVASPVATTPPSGSTSTATPAWLSINPASGTTTAATPSAVTVSAKIAGLAAGEYEGSAVFTPDPASGAPPVHVRALLVVTSTPASKHVVFGVERDGNGSPAATQDLVAVFTSPADGFISDVAAPPDMKVTVLDSSGAPVQGATVTVSSSNGDPNLTLDDLGGGQYEAPFRALNSGSVVLTGSAQLGAETAPAFAVSGDLEDSTDSPSVIFQGGAVSAASFAASPAPLAPGSLISLFGKNVSGSGGSASTVPLPTDLNGVSVTIGGMPAPLLVADPASDQINLQVPFELDGQAEADIVVNDNGVLSVQESVEIGAAPALFTQSSSGSGAGEILHQDGVTPVTESSPASQGEVIVLYATGLGAVFPAAQTGTAATGDSTVAGTVTVTIGGLPAQVQFAGLAPGFVGLYQINVQVPAGVQPGNAPVLLSINGTPATGQATVAIH